MANLLQDPVAMIPAEPDPFYQENGRQYCAWHHPGPYSCLTPNDEREKSRLDMGHKMFVIAMNMDLHRAALPRPVSGGQWRILDLGCGTGIWSLDMAKHYPEALTKGLDMSMMQPRFIFPNSRFQRMNLEYQWRDMGSDFRPGVAHLINARMLKGNIRSWPHLYREAFRHLMPEIGMFEQVEMDWQPRSDNGPIPPHLARWAEEMFRAHDHDGRGMRINPVQIQQQIEEVGFTDVKHEVIKLNCNRALDGPDEMLNAAARWCHAFLCASLPAMSLGPLSRTSGWNKIQIEELIRGAEFEISQRNTTAYFQIHIWTARRRAA